MKCLYKYPQAEFPYQALLDVNRAPDAAGSRIRADRHRACFDENRYFDIFIEYAKADDNDILIRVTVTNRGPDAAPLHVLPTLWFRNTWTWHQDPQRPSLS